MADELIEALAAADRVRVEQPAMAVELPAHAPGHDMAQPEQREAMAAAFAAQEREANLVAGWIGMWTGTLLMHDILKETASESEEDREKKLADPRKKKQCC